MRAAILVSFVGASWLEAVKKFGGLVRTATLRRPSPSNTSDIEHLSTDFWHKERRVFQVVVA